MEYKIILFFNQLGRGTNVDNLSYFASAIPTIVLFFILLTTIVLIFDYPKSKWLFWGTIFVCLIYFILNDLILKQTLASIFFRERPYLAYPVTIIPSTEEWVDSSFWSGHMALIVGIFTLYLWFYRKFWWVWTLAIILTLIMAFSRMHNGMHYPSDVLVGTLFGIAYGFLAVLMVKKLQKKQ